MSLLKLRVGDLEKSKPNKLDLEKLKPKDFSIFFALKVDANKWFHRQEGGIIQIFFNDMGEREEEKEEEPPSLVAELGKVGQCLPFFQRGNVK